MPRLPSRRVASFSLLLGTMLLGAAPAHAQTGGILPLVSVGQKWPQAQETYVIQVSAQDAGKPLNLEVYSPTLNLADYADGRRGEGYFGDELYKTNEPFESTFTLSGPGGLVAERRYGANRAHTWESLFAGGLSAGTYTLKVSSRGDGKNSFALRVSAPFNLETSDFSVNARDTEQAPPGRASECARLLGQQDLQCAELRPGRPPGGRNLAGAAGRGAGQPDAQRQRQDRHRPGDRHGRHGRRMAAVYPGAADHPAVQQRGALLVPAGDQPTPARVGGFTP
ncbi:hypothetical protein ACFSC4_05045 [Deinococcus malanensis]|uniref:hypothetical protein n=1 Tax=Deinococcus malanensis TaxID=1706855 RepID=UPI0036260C1A